MRMSRVGKTVLHRARPLVAMQRPRNILILISDEHRRDAISAAGHPHVLTPNLDGLCQSGVRFLNAYTPSPMCVPARAALATDLVGFRSEVTPAIYAGITEKTGIQRTDILLTWSHTHSAPRLTL